MFNILTFILYNFAIAIYCQSFSMTRIFESIKNLQHQGFDKSKIKR